MNKPVSDNDPLSEGAADLSAGIARAKAVFIEAGLAYPPADLVDAARRQHLLFSLFALGP
jgi:hypothetical protein